MRKVHLAVAAALIIAGFALSGGGCDKAGDKAKRDCEARGGTYQSTGQHSGKCTPPRNGWQ